MLASLNRRQPIIASVPKAEEPAGSPSWREQAKRKKWLRYRKKAKKTPKNFRYFTALYGGAGRLCHSRRGRGSDQAALTPPAPALSSSRRRAGFIPNCNAAPASSWTPITGGTATGDGEPFETFEPSLFVWVAVMSRPAEDRAIVDAGRKALGLVRGGRPSGASPPRPYERASDEHRRLAVSAASNRLVLGDKIRLIPGHCDPAVNLYDWYVCVRGNRVEQVWPITARGAVYRTGECRCKLKKSQPFPGR